MVNLTRRHGRSFTWQKIDVNYVELVSKNDDFVM